MTSDYRLLLVGYLSIHLPSSLTCSHVLYCSGWLLLLHLKHIPFERCTNYTEFEQGACTSASIGTRSPHCMLIQFIIRRNMHVMQGPTRDMYTLSYVCRDAFTCAWELVVAHGWRKESNAVLHVCVHVMIPVSNQGIETIVRGLEWKLEGREERDERNRFGRFHIFLRCPSQQRVSLFTCRMTLCS